MLKSSNNRLRRNKCGIADQSRITEFLFSLRAIKFATGVKVVKQPRSQAPSGNLIVANITYMSEPKPNC